MKDRFRLLRDLGLAVGIIAVITIGGLYLLVAAKYQKFFNPW